MKSLCLLPLLYLSACSTQHPASVALRPQDTSPETDNSALRHPEIIHTYHVGRYTDPGNSLLLNERHAVYRVEASPRWNLHPHDGPVNLPAAPTHDQTFAPVPVNEEILAEVNSQKAATAQIIAQAGLLTASLAQFQTVLQQSKTNLQETAALRAVLIGMEKRLTALEAGEGKTTDINVTNKAGLFPFPVP
jgi:hypothetical protein